MKITIIQNITNIFDEDRNLLTTRSSEQYLIKADEGKQLRDTKTNTLSKQVAIKDTNKISNYVEVAED